MVKLETAIGIAIARPSPLALLGGLLLPMSNLKIFVIVLSLLGFLVAESLHQSAT
jgi:hypothetical protein